MRRICNLGLFAIIASVTALALVVVLRPVVQRAMGFLPTGAQDALGRPAGLAAGADGALYVSDDKGGFIYRIVRR